jgi:hypothetical protein
VREAPYIMDALLKSDLALISFGSLMVGSAAVVIFLMLINDCEDC